MSNKRGIPSKSPCHNRSGEGTSIGIPTRYQPFFVLPDSDPVPRGTGGAISTHVRSQQSPWIPDRSRGRRGVEPAKQRDPAPPPSSPSTPTIVSPHPRHRLSTPPPSSPSTPMRGRYPPFFRLAGLRSGTQGHGRGHIHTRSLPTTPMDPRSESGKTKGSAGETT